MHELDFEPNRNHSGVQAIVLPLPSADLTSKSLSGAARCFVGRCAMALSRVVEAAGARMSPTRNAILRRALREQTSAIHERLHHHDGFHAVQLGSIDLKDYSNLLKRLYGFYLAYEAAAQTAPERSDWLRRDLASLSSHDQAWQAIPLCDHMPMLNTVERRLGALYVVEGSTLGGRALALRLDPICGVGVAEGRRFFQGRGGGTGEAWSGILKRINDYDDDETTHAAVIEAALETFACFERWMAGWRTASND